MLLPGQEGRDPRRSEALENPRRADAVVRFSGYVSTPAYLAARKLGIPVVIHEQNARPDSNRLGARFADVVALTFASTRSRESTAPKPLASRCARDRRTRPARNRSAAARRRGPGARLFPNGSRCSSPVVLSARRG